jgi:hypothetical protein
MKLYQVTSVSLRVRSAPNASASIITTLPRGAKFWSDEQTPGMNGSLWANRLVESSPGVGKRHGFLCVHDRLTKFCQEVPTPTEAPLELPPMPENPGGLSPDVTALLARIFALEGRVKTLEDK